MSTIFHDVSGLVIFLQNLPPTRIQKLNKFLPNVDEQSSIQKLGVVVRGMIVLELFSFYISQEKSKAVVDFELSGFSKFAQR